MCSPGMPDLANSSGSEDDMSEDHDDMLGSWQPRPNFSTRSGPVQFFPDLATRQAKHTSTSSDTRSSSSMANSGLRKGFLARPSSSTSSNPSAGPAGPAEQPNVPAGSHWQTLSTLVRTSSTARLDQILIQINRRPIPLMPWTHEVCTDENQLPGATTTRRKQYA